MVLKPRRIRGFAIINRYNSRYKSTIDIGIDNSKEHVILNS